MVYKWNRRHSTFVFHNKEISYYLHDLPELGPPIFFMENDREIIDKYMVLNKNKVFLDLGAHIGSWTLPALSTGATVIAIEPHPIIARCLLENIQLNSYNIPIKLRLINKAAWGTNDWIPFYIDLSSTFTTLGWSEDIFQPIYVSAITIDSLNLERIDLMKIDIEGAEIEALKGAQETLERCKPIIILENHKDLCGEVEIENYEKQELKDGKYLFTPVK